FLSQMFKDRNVATQLVRRAETAGFKAIVLTVDSAVFGRKKANIKNRFTYPSYVRLKNYEGMDLDKTKDSSPASVINGIYDRSLNWKVI
ncbi:peroxisomal -2-hydroxy-acid oxidase GLO1-like, partial [Trifolium medium]|nr:peroxisomal -2-hydroxy-acid oxidase GLO1-like [Trifolium medium]